VAGSCEHGNEPSGFIKCGYIVGCVTRWYLLKDNCVGWLITNCLLRYTCTGAHTCAEGSSYAFAAECFIYLVPERGSFITWKACVSLNIVCQLPCSRIR
jgi:hypothetical protein